ncbi:MAG: type I restriction-modification enzyme R subunit C-terminal domain-containing protein, partial [Gemmatimonadales bacterium]
RIALRNQALDAFKEFMPPEPRWPERGETTFQRNRRIYVTTYPTMLNLIQGGTERDTWISPYFFDVIIADESHRSIYNVYRQVVDYFAGIKLGLTATPRDHVEHDTFKLFDCAPGDPSFAYSYEEAIEHDPPYLCNFEVLKVRSKFQLEGIKGRTLPPEIQEKLQAEGKDVADIDFEGTDLEHKVTNAGTNGIIVREFMEECIKDPDGVLPGKTIFFAISKAHARRLQELFDQMYPEYQGRLARVLVSEDSRVYGKGGLLDQFRNQDFPRVAISVDMLDTGVDVREVVNLVFAKPVLSYVKFWQMIGRGTRVLEEDPNRRKPWCPAKDRFLIIDCWGNFDYFKMNPEGREPGKQVPVPVRLFRARLDKLEAALAAGNDAVRAAVIEDLREDIAGLPSQNVIVSEAAGELDRVSSGDFWRRLNEGDLGFLRTAIAPLMRTRTDIDFKAARFATDVTEYATLVLAHADPHDNAATKDALRDAIVTQVDELPATNIVLKEEELIERVRRESWWDDATDDDLRDIARRLGPLMKYRQSERDPIVKLNLADVTVLKESIEFGPKHERLATAAYRERVERAVRELVAEVPALQKLQNGQDVSDEDIEKLAAILAEHDPYVTEELLRKIYDNRKARFVDFMRHILGVGEVENWSAWVTSEFDRFIAEHTTFGTLQLRLIHTLKTFVLQTRRIDKPSLIKAPFTQVHPKGIRGVFSDAEIEEILEFGRGLVA